MSDIAIRIENLGKRYRYGGAAPLSANLRADLTEWAKGLLRRSRRSEARSQRSEDRGQMSEPRGVIPGIDDSPAPASDLRPLTSDPRPPSSGHRPTLHQIHEAHLDADPNYFWALKDINLEIKQGEVVGVIGRNGAGKSTLLKVLSRITPPTTGKITYHGRVSSLLEVGTGFHRELTGRENIFLNGSILGMRRTDIAKRLDSIVAFAEVEKFIDTPVKFYSSGMYVRLAFAVAAHLEPDILLVDEVLAVGDAGFQKRCLGKMGEVARQGRTVLFVSHNMAAISSLCARAILLRGGRLAADGDTSTVVAGYLSQIASEANRPASPGSGRGQCKLVSAAVRDGSGFARQSVRLDEAFTVTMVYDVAVDNAEKRVPNIHFCTGDGSYIFVVNAPRMTCLRAGRYRATCHIPPHFLNEGTISIGLAVTSYSSDSYKVDFFERSVLCLNVIDPKVTDEFTYGYVGTIPGVVRPRLEWTNERIPA